MLTSGSHSDTGVRSDVTEFGMAGARVEPHVAKQAHRHNEIELNFVEAGKIDLLFGNYRYVLGKGAFYAFWAAVPHNIVRVEEGSRLFWVTVPFESFIHWRLSDSLIENLLSAELVADFSREYHLKDRVNFTRWVEDLQSGSDRLKDAVLFEVEARIIRLESDLSLGKAVRPFIEGESPLPTTNLKAHSMARFICENYRQPIVLADIAARVNLHPNYAMKLFKDVFGTNISGFLARYRVVQAQRLLLLTNKKIEDIVVEAGFGSTSQFYAAFKKYTFQSPHKFRNAY